MPSAPGYPSANGKPIDWTTYPQPTNTVVVQQEDPALAVATQRIHLQNGSAAAYVVAASGEGIESLWTPVFPLLPNRVFFTAEASLFLASGEVLMEVITDDGAGTITTISVDANGVDVTTDVLNRFVTDLAHVGLDFTGVQFAKVRFTAFGGPATFFVDAAMLTQTPGGLGSFVEGLQSNQLWFETLRVLALRGTPDLRYKIGVKDLHRLDPTTFVYEALNLGATVHTVDLPLAIDDLLRIVKIVRDLLHEGVTSVDVSNRNDGLARFLARERFASRRGVTRTGSGGGLPPPASGTGQLSRVRVIERVAGIHQVLWDHDNLIELDVAGRFTLDIVERIYTGAGFTTLEQQATLATGRDPKLDSLAPPAVVNAGSLDVAHTLGSTSKRYEYEVTLRDAGTLVNTYLAPIEGAIYGVLP